MIRGVFVLGEQGNMMYSKEYAKGDSKANMVEFLVNLTHFLKTIDLEEFIQKDVITPETKPNFVKLDCVSYKESGNYIEELENEVERLHNRIIELERKDVTFIDGSTCDS